MTSELESDLKGTVNWDRNWLADFTAGKTELLSFEGSNNCDAICVKMNGSNLDEKLSFKMLGFSLFSKLDWGTYIVSIAKSASKKNLVFVIQSLFLLRLLFISKDVPYYLRWNTAVMHVLVFLAVPWAC